MGRIRIFESATCVGQDSVLSVLGGASRRLGLCPEEMRQFSLTWRTRGGFKFYGDSG